MYRLTLAAASSLTAALISITAVWAQDTITLRVYHSTSAESTYHHTIEYLGQRLDELTDGKVEVKEFGGGSLGTETTTLDLYGTGDIDLGFHHTAAVSSVIPQLGIFDVPFLFQSFDHWKQTVTAGAGREIIEKWIAEAGSPFEIAMIGLGGERSIYTKSTIIDSVESLEGLKLRVTQSPIAVEVWSAIGMSPIALPWGDIYGALQSGLIEGVDNTPGWYNDAKHIEVAKNWFWTRHMFATQLVLVGKQALERIPEDLHDEFRRALDETQEWWIKRQVAFDQNAVDNAFPKHNVVQHEMPPELMDEIRSRVTPLAQQTAENLEATEMLEAIRQGS